MTVPWFRGPRFNPRPVQKRLVVDTVVVRQVFLQVLQFSLVSIMPPMLHTHSFIEH